MKRIIRNPIFTFIVGVIVTSSIVGALAYSYQANEISYTTNKNSSVENVEQAINDLYTKEETLNTSLATAQSNLQTCQGNLTTCQNAPKGKNNTVYFAYGDPTTSSTTDYTTLNKKVFVALNGTQKSVCIIRNSKLHCFDNNNWVIEKDHIQQVFSDVGPYNASTGLGCYLDGNNMICQGSDLYCNVYSYGAVYCFDPSADSYCVVDADGSVYYG